MTHSKLLYTSLNRPTFPEILLDSLNSKGVDIFIFKSFSSLRTSHNSSSFLLLLFWLLFDHLYMELSKELIASSAKVQLFGKCMSAITITIISNLKWNCHSYTAQLQKKKKLFDFSAHQSLFVDTSRGTPKVSDMFVSYSIFPQAHQSFI